MNYRTPVLLFSLLNWLLLQPAVAQVLPGSIPTVLSPSNPTSADNLKLSMSRSCNNLLPFIGNPYAVSMTQNRITVTLGQVVSNLVPLCPPSPAPIEEIDLGRLPAGSYTLTVIVPPAGTNPAQTAIDNVPFTVADARATKATPYVRMDYSGHWWDPNDSGWGLFIWQDAKSSNDSVLAAWFTYKADGSPMWYVFQPTWQSSTATSTALLVQTSRLPGSSSPPPTATTPVAIGSARLDFSSSSLADTGKITYTFNGGPTLVRNITRFKP